MSFPTSLHGCFRIPRPLLNRPVIEKDILVIQDLLQQIAPSGAAFSCIAIGDDLFRKISANCLRGESGESRLIFEGATVRETPGCRQIDGTAYMAGLLDKVHFLLAGEECRVPDIQHDDLV